MKRYPTLAAYFQGANETQEQLAARVGTTQATISRIAAGDSCRLELAKKIAAATGVPIENIGTRIAS